MKRFISVAIFAVLTASLLCSGSVAEQARSLDIGAPIPQLELPTTRGDRFSLSSLKGKPVVLTFYAIWSKSCLENLKFLSSLQEKFRNLEVVTVAFENKTASLDSFIRTNNIDLLTLIDKKKKSLDNFQILIIPMTFLVDRNGILQNIYVDFDDSVKESMVSDIKQILSNKD